MDAVIFSDVRQNLTWRWLRSERLQEEMHPSHHQNGHTLDAGGRLVACSHGQRALVRQEENGAWTILADTFEGRRLSSPNDVTLSPDGSLWFYRSHLRPRPARRGLRRRARAARQPRLPPRPGRRAHRSHPRPPHAQRPRLRRPRPPPRVRYPRR
ncbi:SMP-30/gluconolactonase/LRE family protein [Deinococcus aetherius]|uniref:SMP-30/gluconolactonase/LRE family protein n=1 Tax=Deinococcus aetherius TaxID=200252 RepID=UPI00222E1D03|nr:SMP-30/gluconolactonase/LRE family protein [Deinococcus aetherius]